MIAPGKSVQAATFFAGALVTPQQQLEDQPNDASAEDRGDQGRVYQPDPCGHDHGLGDQGYRLPDRGEVVVGKRRVPSQLDAERDEAKRIERDGGDADVQQPALHEVPGLYALLPIGHPLFLKL